MLALSIEKGKKRNIFLPVCGLFSISKEIYFHFEKVFDTKRKIELFLKFFVFYDRECGGKMSNSSIDIHMKKC